MQSLLIDFFHIDSKILGAYLLKKNGSELIRLKLLNGENWICKKFMPSNWLGTIELANLIVTENIHYYFDKSFYGKSEPGRFAVVNNSIYLLLPYVNGTVGTINHIQKAYRLGRLLAYMHSLSLPKTASKPLPLLHGANMPENLPPTFQKLIEFCNKNASHQAQFWLCSHRDLHEGNIIWLTGKPHLIDWESAGLIHPFIELIGLACNCSGVVALQFKKHYFTAVLEGYRQHCPLPKDDAVLWQLIFQTWLLWLSYQHLNRQDLTLTLNIIKYLYNIRPFLRDIYKDILEKKL